MTTRFDPRHNHQRREGPRHEHSGRQEPGHQDLGRQELGVYVISVAAELANVHPQTLRSYERAGLIEPARTPGGDRRYSDTDLERVSRITQLSDEGINLNGIGRILELEAQVQQLETELDRARRQVAAVAPRAGRTSAPLVPTRQALVPWRHPLDFSIPNGGT